MRRLRNTLLIGIGALMIVIIGIGGLALMGPAVGNIYSGTVQNLTYSGEPPATMAAFAPPTATAMAAQLLPVSDTRQGQARQPQPQTQGRIILRNATLNITVDDPEAKIDEIIDMANGMGGWIVSSNTSTFINNAGEESTRGSVTVRVPAERLDEALERIQTGSISVDNENITGQDVTQDYVDVSSRLENLKSSERQLQAIMESAETVEDVLAVQIELTTIRGEIEVLQGRINYYDESAAFSSITVGVQPPQPGPVERQSAVWNPASTTEVAVGRLVGVVQFMVDVAINLIVVVLPFVILVGIPIWFIRRRRQQRAA